MLQWICMLLFYFLSNELLRICFHLDGSFFAYDYFNLIEFEMKQHIGINYLFDVYCLIISDILNIKKNHLQIQLKNVIKVIKCPIFVAFHFVNWCELIHAAPSVCIYWNRKFCWEHRICELNCLALILTTVAWTYFLFAHVW